MTPSLAVVFCVLSTANPATDVNNLEQRPIPEVEYYDEQWFDVWQQNLSESMDATAVQLDSLFADNTVTGERAKAEGRIRVSWEPRSRNMSQTDVRFRIRVTLPALEERVDLLLSDNEDESITDGVAVTRTPVFDEGDRATIALRYRPVEDSHYSFRLGAGRRDQLYVDTRYRDAMALSDHWSFMYDGEVYYYTRDQLGAEVGAIFQNNRENKQVTRFNNRYFYRHQSRDWRWRHEIQHFVPLNEHHAVIYNFLLDGFNEPNYRVEEVYAGVRWRMNPLRNWLYFDVEPFVLGLRDEDFSPSIGVALRVEAYYGKR